MGCQVSVRTELHDGAHLQQPLVHVEEDIDVGDNVGVLDALQHLGLAQGLVAVMRALASHLLNSQELVAVVALQLALVGRAHAALPELLADLVPLHFWLGYTRSAITSQRASSAASTVCQSNAAPKTPSYACRGSAYDAMSSSVCCVLSGVTKGDRKKKLRPSVQAG